MGKNSIYMGSVGVILTALCLLTSCRGEILPTEEPSWETGQEQVGDADQSLVLVRGYGTVTAEGETVQMCIRDRNTDHRFAAAVCTYKCSLNAGDAPFYLETLVLQHLGELGCALELFVAVLRITPDRLVHVGDNPRFLCRNFMNSGFAVHKKPP